MPSDLELQTERSGRLRAGSSYEKAIDRYAAARKARAEAEERRRLAEAQARQEAMLQSQQLAAQARRQEQEQAYGMQSTAQRANINADAANMDHVYTTQRDQLQQKGIQKRDKLQAGYDKEQNRLKALDQQIRDQRMFGFSTQENDQQHRNTLQRDELQHGNTMQRDQQQFVNQTERDASQFGFQTQENAQQFSNQMQRDEYQNQYSMQRDEYQNQYSMQREEQQQGYTQQNMYQRQAAEVQAKWNDQVQKAKASGLDFSPRQQQEMKELDATFRKNVLNNPDLDEGLKQQAMYLHQQKVSAIIPEDKVSKPEDEIAGQFYEDPRMGMMRRVVGRNGNPEWEPLGFGSNGQQQDPAKIQAEQKKEADRINKLTLERHLKFNDTLQEVREAIDPDTLEKKYKDDDAIDKEVMKRFAPQEQYYTNSDLPPHEFYQLQARKDEEKNQKELLKQQRAEAKRLREMPKQDINMPFGGKPDPIMQTSPNVDENPWRQKLQAKSDARKPIANPVTVSSKNLDDQVKQSLTSGDEASAAAMQAVKTITAKFKGVPPLGSPERQELEDAMRFLGAKGYKFGAEEKKPTSPRPFEYGYPGM